MKRYLFEHQYEGNDYTFDVPADSLDEAKGRVLCMSTAKYVGELHAVVPAAIGPFVRLFVWWKNLWMKGRGDA